MIKKITVVLLLPAIVIGSLLFGIISGILLALQSVYYIVKIVLENE